MGASEQSDEEGEEDHCHSTAVKSDTHDLLLAASPEKVCAWQVQVFARGSILFIQFHRNYHIATSNIFYLFLGLQRHAAALVTITLHRGPPPPRGLRDHGMTRGPGGPSWAPGPRPQVPRGLSGAGL